MKTGKSADENGICSEHFKYSPEEVIPFIVFIMNKIFDDLDVPKKLKSGIVTPVLKPKKDKLKTKPSNELIGICDICGYHYKTKSNFHYHMYSKHKSNDLNKKCPYCNKVLPFLTKHIKQVHLETQCTQCGKMFPGTLRLANHKKSAHTSMEDRPLKCTTCGKGFFYQNCLDDHYNVHTGAKPYKCKYCPAAFASKGTHAMHQKSHLGIKRKFKNK